MDIKQVQLTKVSIFTSILVCIGMSILMVLKPDQNLIWFVVILINLVIMLVLVIILKLR